MNDPVKQRYVPQSYLKFFAQKRTKIWEVVVADKKNKKPYLANIRDVAFKKHFYTVENLGPQKYIYEDYYANQVEPLIRTTFDRLISRCSTVFAKNKDIVIDNELKAALSIILIAQLLRTPKSRAYQYEISSRIFPTAMEEIMKKLEPHIKLDQKERLNKMTLDDMFKEIDMSIITDMDTIKKFAQIINDKQWVVYRNDDYKENPFVTSDHPMVQSNLTGTSTSLGSNGIGNLQTLIHFPINPQLVLALYDREHFLFQFTENMDKRLIILDRKRDASYIMKLNQMQYEQCTQHVFLSLSLKAVQYFERRQNK